MYKNILNEIFTDRLMHDKITEEKYYKLTEAVVKMSDERAKELVTEITKSGKVNRKAAFSTYGGTADVVGAVTGSSASTLAAGQGALTAGGVSAGVASGIMTGVGIASLLTYPIYRAIRGKFDKCSKACGTYALNTPKRQICMAKCKVLLYTQLYNEVHKKDPSKAAKIKAKLEKAKQNYEGYAKFAKETGRNPNPKVTPGTKSRFSIPG